MICVINGIGARTCKNERDDADYVSKNSSQCNDNGEMPVRSFEKEDSLGCCKYREGERKKQQEYAEEGLEDSVPDLRREGGHGIGTHINEGYGEKSLKDSIINQLNTAPDAAYAHNAVVNNL